jgi:hypothetical protein
MFKTLFLLSPAMSLLVSAQEVSNMRGWVKAATLIYVRMDGLNSQFHIENSTNIMDIKKNIRKYEGVPTEYQIIKPYWKRWWTLWLTEGYGDPLKNEEIVKQVMSTQNTNLFEMHDGRQSRKDGKS